MLPEPDCAGVKVTVCVFAFLKHSKGLHTELLYICMLSLRIFYQTIICMVSNDWVMTKYRHAANSQGL